MIIPNEKLHRARLEKRWSVSVASRRTGVSTNTFNRWERGLQVPQLATLDQLCATFEMSADDLGFGFIVSPQKKTGLEFLLEDQIEVEDEKVVTASSSPYVTLAARPQVVKTLLKPSIGTHIQPASGASGEEEELSRRQVIATLIGSPAAAFGARQGDNLSLLRVEEILTLCAAHVPLCWQLYFEGGLIDVERVLPDYIAQLSRLVRQPSSYHKRAASLLSQAYQLASLVATQHQDYGLAYTYARQGLYYGEMAEDPGLQVASSIREALVYFYLKRVRPRYHAYQRALQLVPQTSALFQSRVHAGLAESYSLLAEETEGWRCLALAQETFPLRAEDDPCFAYTHFTVNLVSSFEGRMHLNLNQPAQAWQAFARIDKVLPAGMTPNRLELLIHQAMAACALGELEQTSDLLETAVPMAQEIGSQLRIDESYEVYEQMLLKWGQEPLVKELEDLFVVE